MTGTEIIRSIADGHADGQLDQIRDAIRRREVNVAAVLASTLAKGDKVRIKRDRIKPKYLGNQVATVTRVEGDRVFANLDAEEFQVGRYAGEVGLPIGAIEAVTS